MAFAVGGYDFCGDSAVQITEMEAVNLIRAYGAKLRRDSASGALYFDYTKSNEKHTVFFADSETLGLWVAEAMKEGVFSFAIWRAGGNLTIGEIFRD